MDCVAQEEYVERHSVIPWCFSEEFVSYKLQQKRKEIIDNAMRILEVLSVDRQALWAMLRLSTMSCFEYFCQLAPVSLSEPVAGTLDEHLWTTLEAAVGFTVPKGENGNNITCPVAQLQGQSYQEWVVRLPVRLHDWGLRSLAETCGPTYMGAMPCQRFGVGRRGVPCGGC